MPKKTPINWKTIAAWFFVASLLAGWAVTAYTTEDNKKEIKDTKDDVEDIQSYITEQRTMNSAQYAINQSLVELLKKEK